MRSRRGQDGAQERRLITALAVMLEPGGPPPPGIDPDEATALRRSTVLDFKRISERAGAGMVSEQPERFVAVLGLNVTHRDDALHAVRLAMQLQHEVERVRQRFSIDGMEQVLRLRVGIDLGRMIGAPGVEASGPDREGSDPISSACRLASQSCGPGVVASAGVFRLARREFAFQRIDQDPLAGGDSFLLIGPRGRGWEQEMTASGLVGRKAELSRIVQALEDVRESRSSIIVLTGEGGVGKTRLAFAALERVRSLGWTVIDATGRSGSQQAQLGDLLSGLSGGNPSRDRLVAHLTSVGVDEPEADADLLLAHLGLARPAGTRHPTAVMPQARRQRALESLTALAVAIANEGPCAIWLGNLDRADPEVVDWFGHCARYIHWSGLGPLQLALIAEAAKAPQIVGLGAPGASPVQTVAVPPLTADETTELLASLLGIWMRPDSWAADLEKLARDLFSRSGGNPLIAEELVRAMESGGLLANRPDGTWKVVRGLGDSELPGSLESLLAARLDALREPLRAFLRAGSVMGETFDAGVLASLVQSDCDSNLDELETEGILKAIPGGRYAFSPLILRKVVYESLLPADRRKLHLAVADALQLSAEGEADLDLAAIASHFDLAGDRANAVKYYELLGEREHKRWAIHTAASAFERAYCLASASQVGTAAQRVRRLRLSLAEVLTAALRAREAIPYWQAETASWEAGAASVAYREIGKLYTVPLGDYERAEFYLERALIEARAAGILNHERAALGAMGTLAFFESRYRLAVACAESAIGDGAGLAPAQEGDWRSVIGNAFLRLGRPDRAVEELERSRQCRASCRDADGLVRSLNSLAAALIEFDRPQEALAHLDRAEAMARRLGIPQRIAMILNNRGEAKLALDDLSEACHSYREALAIYETIGDRRGSVLALTNLGNGLVRSGEVTAGHTQLEAACEVLAGLGEMDQDVRVWARMAEAYALDGEFDMACQAASRAERLVSKSESAVDGAFLVRARACLDWRQHAGPDALSGLRDALESFKASQMLHQARLTGELLTQAQADLDALTRRAIKGGKRSEREP